MKFLFFSILLFLGLFSLTLSVSPLRSPSKTSNPRLKTAFKSTLPTPFSCTCGVYVPLCDLLFAKIKQEFGIAITATPNTKNGPNGEFFKAAFPDYNLANMVARIDSPKLKSLAEAIGIDKISLTGIELTVSVGSVYGAYFKGKISFNSVQVDFQVTFIKDLHMAVWAGLTITYSSMLKSVESVMAKGTSPKALGDNSKAMLGTFQSLSFTMIIQNGEMNFEKTPELTPALLSANSEDKDRLVSDKAALILMAKVQFSQIATTTIGKLLSKCGITAFTLLARIQTDEFYAEAALDKVEFGSSVKLIRPSLYVKLAYSAPQDVEFGIQAQLQVTLDADRKLTFDGAILFTPKDAGFRFAMREIYTKAFGLSRLHFGRLMLQMKLSYALGIPTQFAIGGEVAIGDTCYNEAQEFVGATHCLHVKAYVGVNVGGTGGNFLYVESGSRLNLKTIATALFGSKTSPVNIPNFLVRALEIHDGMIISFATKAEKFEYTVYNEKLEAGEQKKVSVDVPQGFQFDGTVTLLGVTAKLIIKLVKTGESLGNFEGTIDVENAIQLGSVLTISRFEEGSTKGPFMSIKLAMSPVKLSLDVSARIKFFGFNTGTKLVFDDSQFSFDFDAKWDYAPFAVSLHVDTSYDDLAINRFHLKGIIKKDTEGLKSFFTNLGTILKGSLDVLKQKLGEMAGAIKNGFNKLSSWWRSWFGGFKEKNMKASYGFVASFWENMIRTDRAKAERIVAAYKAGVNVICQINEVSFAIDYDDVVECNRKAKTLKIKMTLDGIVMDKAVKMESEINLSDWVVSGLSWALGAIDKSYSDKT